jgi:hypothetical protein
MLVLETANAASIRYPSSTALESREQEAAPRHPGAMVRLFFYGERNGVWRGQGTAPRFGSGAFQEAREAPRLQETDPVTRPRPPRNATLGLPYDILGDGIDKQVETALEKKQ